MVREGIHTVFESDFPGISVLFDERSGYDFVELYACRTLEIRKHRHLDFRVLISEERALDLLVEER